MHKFNDNTPRTLALLAIKYPQLLKLFEEFHASFKQFAARHLENMVVGDLFDKTSFEVALAGATLRVEFQAALDDARPVGLITAYEPRPKNQSDYRVDSLVFDQNGMSDLGVRNADKVDFVYIAETVVLEMFRKLLTSRIQLT